MTVGDKDPLPFELEPEAVPAPEDNVVPIAAAPEPEPDLSTQILTDQMMALKTENATLKDQALRALADAENARRRAEKDRDDASKYAIANFARGLLAVADNLRRAIDAIPADLRGGDARVDGIVAGIEATERDLLSAFDRVGIRKVAALDQPFNANFHEVMVEIPGTGKPPRTVVQVIEDGYTIHDRLLRPARVAVAKADPGAAADGHSVDTEV